MFKNLIKGIERRMEGKTCSRCKDLGVECRTATFFNGVSGEPGDIVIYVDGKPELRTREAIAQCPVVLCQSTREDVVGKIKSNVEKLKHSIDLSDHKISNW
jgi:hypothetical protein